MYIPAFDITIVNYLYRTDHVILATQSRERNGGEYTGRDVASVTVNA